MMVQIAQRIGIPFVLLILGTLYFAEVSAGKPQDMMLIKPVFYLMVFLFFVNGATDLRDIMRSRQDAKAKKESDSLKKILCFAALAVVLVGVLPYLGFVFSALLFTFGALMLFEVDRKPILIAMPVIVSLALYLLFEWVFGVELPAGPLGF